MYLGTRSIGIAIYKPLGTHANNTLMDPIRATQTLGLTTSLVLAGVNIGSSALTIPILLTRPASTTAPIFHEFYLRGAALNVPLGIFSAACSASIA
ncbi:MAG: hypothetical protein L6R37_007745 [Teloschistes peruensis]|nr:MAG: hypothetical protein L6R37_007745 [Teloschistes peruensis]